MAEIEHKHFRSALEFAVLMASEGQKRKPALPFPKDLRPFFNKARLPSGALGRLRRTVDADPIFRSRLAAGAMPELVDDIGRLWLDHRDGWEAEAAAIVDRLDAESQSGDHRAQVRRAEKRRDAAEQAAARTRVELLHRDEVVAMQATEIDDLRAEVAKVTEVLAEMKTELTDVRMEIRHARDREAAATSKADVIAGQLRELQGNEALAPPPDAVDRSAEFAAHFATEIGPEIKEVSAAARQLATHLEALLPAGDESADDGSPQGRGGRVRRTPLALPGGVIASSAEAAEFLAKSSAAFVVDGYNVAKLGWPNRPLEQQREVFLDAVENLVRRFGTDVTVVFDGASIVGAHTTRRRQARVMFSPEGTIADDVIRDEVKRLPVDRPVVVVTNDAEIVSDVRADGANVVPSNALIALV